MDIKSGNQKLEKLLTPEIDSQGARSSAAIQLAKLLRNLYDLPSQKELDECYLREVMRRSGDSQVKAAKVMGITPQALCSKLKKSNRSAP